MGKGGLQIGIEGGVEHEVKVDKADVDVNVNANIGAGGNVPDADIELDADGKVKGKGGLDFNMPHMKMPKFGFGGKGNKTDGDIDFDGNVSLPSNEGKHHDGEIKVTTPEIKTSVDTPNVDADGKGSGGIDLNMPKFGFGGHKGSKKKKKDKKK